MAISTIVHRATLALGLWLLACSAVASGIAVVTDLQGRTTLSNAGRSADAAILSDLQAGSQAQVAANASLVVLYLADGSEYQIKGPAQVVFRTDRPEVGSGAPAVRRPAPANGSLRIRPTEVGQGAIVMRSLGSTRIRLLAGNGTLVLDAQPELRWAPPAPDLRYTLDIADDSGRTLQTAEVSGSTFKVPAGLALREGSTYTWEVSARGADGRKYSARGEFGLATAALRAQVLAARSQAVAEVSSQVALALWLEQQELRDDARQLWRDLAQQRPDEAQLRAMAER
jgi:hypothetical protein